MLRRDGTLGKQFSNNVSGDPMSWSIDSSLDQRQKDIVFSLRQLRRARSFSIVAIATLSVGIGATVAVFSLVEAVVLRPLPFANADRALPGVFDGVAALIQGNSFTVLHGETPEVVTATRISSDFLHVFGVNPEVGRGFSTAEDRPGAAHVVMLSHARWMKDYNGQRSAVGQFLQVGGESYAIIGVTPASLDVVNNPDALWVPLALSSTDLTQVRPRLPHLIAITSHNRTRKAQLLMNASTAVVCLMTTWWAS